MPDPEPDEEEIGTGYLTAAEAGEWLGEHVVDIAAWTANSTKQTVAIEEASDAIDALPLRGIRTSSDQEREFPRIPEAAARVVPCDEMNFQSATIDYDEVPSEVLAAVCLEALAILEEIGAGDRKQRRILQQQGVVSATYSTTSETYSEGSGSANRGLRSKRAFALIRPWIAGSMEAV